ncbi:MAG: hypothetical protein IKZ96_01680 [Bacilli bacterium]|nr:hypothetical protein [Bacilli bacterium]
MRYSKKKKITIAVISVICVLLVGFVITKGIVDSMKISDNAEPTKSKSSIVASVSKLLKKSKKKEETNEPVNKVKKSTKDVRKSEKESQKVKEVEESFSDEREESLAGTYTITELKIGDKKYTNSEIKKLKEGGYSLYLEMTKDGTANVSVLYINKLYAYNNEVFDDGTNQIEYKHSGKKIKIKIDDAEMVFKKD